MTSMQDLVANIDHLVFDVEIALESQLGAQLLPFHSMDSKYMCCVFIYHLIFLQLDRAVGHTRNTW